MSNAKKMTFSDYAITKIGNLENTLRRIRDRLALYSPSELPEILADIASALGEFEDVNEIHPTDLVKEARRYFRGVGVTQPNLWFGCEDDASLREEIMETAKSKGLKRLHDVLDLMTATILITKQEGGEG